MVMLKPGHYDTSSYMGALFDSRVIYAGISEYLVALISLLPMPAERPMPKID